MLERHERKAVCPKRIPVRVIAETSREYALLVRGTRLGELALCGEDAYADGINDPARFEGLS